MFSLLKEKLGEKLCFWTHMILFNQFLNCMQIIHSKTNSMQLMLAENGVQLNIILYIHTLSLYSVYMYYVYNI